MNSIKAAAFELGDYKERVLFSDSSDSAVSTTIWRFSKGLITFRLDVYVADMDENAVRNLVKVIKSKVVYKGNFIGVRETVVDFSNCKDITVELAQKN